MLYIGYLIILDGQSIKKNQFQKVPFLSCRGRKTAEASYALGPLGALPPHNDSDSGTGPSFQWANFPLWRGEQRSYLACGAVSVVPAPCGTGFGTRRTLSWGYGVSPDGSCPRLSVPKTFFFPPPPCFPLGSGGVLVTMSTSSSSPIGRLAPGMGGGWRRGGNPAHSELSGFGSSLWSSFVIVECPGGLCDAVCLGVMFPPTRVVLSPGLVVMALLR